jgi:hypothetical protein
MLGEYNLSILSLSKGATACGILRQAQNAGRYSPIVNSSCCPVYRDLSEAEIPIQVTGSRFGISIPLRSIQIPKHQI